VIIARYITKEVVTTWLAITAILLMIALSNRFALFLAKAATGELPMSLVFRIVGLYTPELLSFLMPLSFFISLLFAYGRMHTDSEMAVLFACGFSWGYISRITLFLALIVMTLTGCLSLWIVPKMTFLRETAAQEGEAIAVIHTLLPGRFQVIEDGNIVFYIEDVASKEKLLKNVFIAEQPSNATKETANWTLINAKEARVERVSETKDFYLILNEGHRYQGIPGTGDYTVIGFSEYGRSVQQSGTPLIPETHKLKSTDNLIHSKNLEDTAELQWRLSIPLSVPILALLALPLAHVNPRHGRFARFLPAIVFYIVYYNLFTLSKRWIISKILPAELGVWWVHGSFLIFALFLLSKESGHLRMRWTAKFKQKVEVLFNTENNKEKKQEITS